MLSTIFRSIKIKSEMIKTFPVVQYFVYLYANSVTLYSICYTLYSYTRFFQSCSIHYIIHIIYSIHAIHCIMYTLQCTLYSIHYKASNNETKLYFTHYHSTTSIIEKKINRLCAHS